MNKSFEDGFKAGQNIAAEHIRNELNLYLAIHDRTMADVRESTYATDIATLSATASRQLAAIQALEHVLSLVTDNDE